MDEFDDFEPDNVSWTINWWRLSACIGSAFFTSALVLAACWLLGVFR